MRAVRPCERLRERKWALRLLLLRAERRHSSGRARYRANLSAPPSTWELLSGGAGELAAPIAISALDGQLVWRRD